MGNELSAFFLTLFGIEVTIFGVISAVVLVFVQLVYSNFSYRDIRIVFADFFLILYIVFAAFALGLTIVASLSLSLGSHDLVPHVNFGIKELIANDYYATACLALVILSIAVFAVSLIRNLRYLQPTRVLFLLAKRIENESFAFFLWNQKGITAPFELEIDGKGIHADKKSEARIAHLLKKSVNRSDPLIPVRDMFIQFAKRTDLSGLEEIGKLLADKSVRFTQFYQEQKSEEWKPENDLLRHYTEYFINYLGLLHDIAEFVGLEIAKKPLLSASWQFGSALIRARESMGISEVFKFWRYVGDNAITRSPGIFKEVVSNYETLGEKLFDKKAHAFFNEQGFRATDELFRCLGWLGEQILIKQKRVEEPDMQNHEFSTEFGVLFTALLSFGYEYQTEWPADYPLIYFDALVVVARQLIKIDPRSNEIGTIIYYITRFAIEGIRIKNSNGAGLAVIRIYGIYKELKAIDGNQEASNAFEPLIEIALCSAGYKGEPAESLGGVTIHDWIADKIDQSGERVDNWVHNAYIHAGLEYDHDTVWAFLVKLGMRLRTNFGFMFDPTTGENYPDDHPLRK